jgi:ATP-dependent helicase/nuclease subunit B
MNEGHPVQALWCDPAAGVVARIAGTIAERQLHAARTVVLVPYAQLMGVARGMWARCGTPGFVPRFETTRNWARSAGGFLPTGYDIAFDMARDLVTAQALLSQAGFAAERFALAGRVVELAYQLARWRPRRCLRCEAANGRSGPPMWPKPAASRNGFASKAR